MRLKVDFLSDGDDGRARLFMPDAERLPLVLLGGTRECGLEPFARRFADAAASALVSTCRRVGDSVGRPRQRPFIDGVAARFLLDIGLHRPGRQAATASCALAGRGVGRGSVVACWMTNRPEFHAADIGRRAAGRGIVLELSQYTVDQAAEVLTDAGSARC